MRLEFNLVVVDDQPANITETLEALREKIADEGFVLRDQCLPGIDEVKQKMGESILYDDIDLVAVDFDLGSGQKGDAVIQELRKHIGYRDIVFYSSAMIQDLEAAVAKDKLQGVYCSRRTDLEGNLHELFKDVMRRVLDLGAARGIVMGATCELELNVTEAFARLDQVTDNDTREKLRESVRNRIDRLCTKAKALGALLDEDLCFSKLSQDHSFSAQPRAELVAKYLKLTDKENPARESLNELITEVIPHRNLLAHRPLRVISQDEENVPKEECITEDELREFRKQIIKIQADLENLQERLVFANN